MSFIIILRFNLVSDSKAHWVQVLRANYGVSRRFLETIYCGRCSFLWRTLAKAWSLIRENLLWSMGDGRSIKYWHNLWLLNIAHLVNWIHGHSCLDLDCLLNDMVTDDGNQNLDLFYLWLLEKVINRIVGTPPPYSVARNDRIIWGRISAGPFLLKVHIEIFEETLGI